MNIQTLLTKLNEKMTDAQIGQAIGAPQSIVNRLRRGKHAETFYSRAKAIEELAIAKGIMDKSSDPASPILDLRIDARPHHDFTAE